jgi:DNA polymerase-3 subunit delta
MATVAPEQFLDRLAEGKPVPAVVLLGSDVYWRDLCRSKLIETFVPEAARDWAIARFSLAETSLDAALGQAQTLPMLASRQVVFVEALDALEKLGEKARDSAVAQLTHYLNDPATFTLLVLEAEHLDQRTRLAKLLAEKAVVVELAVSAEAAGGMVFEMARESGVEIDREAAALLVETLAGQLAKVHVELEKLSAYVGERKRVTAADVAELVVSAKTNSVWELAGVLATGPRRRALEFLDSLLREGEAAAGLVAALAWMYRKLIEAQELPPQTTGWQAARQLGMRLETAELAIQQARKIPREQLRAGLVALAEADNRLKSGGGNDRAVMEFLVTELTAESAGVPVRRG